ERAGERRVVAHAGAGELGPVREEGDDLVGSEELAPDDIGQAAEARGRAADGAGGRVARPAAVLGHPLGSTEVAREPLQQRIRAGQAALVEPAQLTGADPGAAVERAVRPAR